MQENLLTIFNNHKGKISDKWLSYIKEWNKLFLPLRQKQINLFEIGVLNGGSLEIWAKYFKQADNIIGCDINQACDQLKFSDQRISVLIGNANSDDIENQLQNLVTNLDIIIDDGSHKSSHIIHSFSRYFKYLRPGGLYIIEDLHTSYWDAFEGGFNTPYSSMGFLKTLADMVNFQHWRNQQTRKDVLKPYEKYFGTNFKEIDLCKINSVMFFNSLCVIRKNNQEDTALGNRIVVGSTEIISEGYKRLHGTSIHDFAFHVTDDSHLNHFYLIDYTQKLQSKIVDKDALIQNNHQVIETLKTKLTKQDHLINELQSDITGLSAKLNQFTREIKTQKQIIESLTTKKLKQEQIIERLTTLKRTQERIVEQLNAQLEEQEQRIVSIEAELSSNKQIIVHKEADLEENTLLNKHLKVELLDREREILIYVLDQTWKVTRPFRKIRMLIESCSFHNFSLKEIIQRRSTPKEIYQYFIIKKSGLFDDEYYLQSNADVRKSNINPLMHFIKYGYKERRNPSAAFQTERYLDIHPEVKYAKTNPLIHYLHSSNNKANTFSFNVDEDHQIRFIDLASKKSKLDAIDHNSNSHSQSPDIIILPIINWDFRFQRPQQLASQFANLGHRVFYVQTKIRYQNNLAPLIKAIKQNIFSVQLSSKDRFANVQTFISSENVNDLLNSFRILRDHYLVNSAIIKIDSPIWRKLAIRLKSDLGWYLIYDCMDLHEGFSNNNLSISYNEQLLLEESDRVFASSYYLVDKISNHKIKASLIPNGTDYDFFNTAKQVIPAIQIRGIDKPIIGYYGAIADWFDTELVGRLASDHPDWSFVLIGDTHLADLEPIIDLSNVFLLGEKPYSEIPKYLSHFDVCLIPFKNIPLTKATNPVKLYEYLSAGKPVVATRTQELTYFDEHIRLASSIKEWEIAIEQSLSENKTPDLLKKRYEFAQSNTWEKRAILMIDQIRSIFPIISIIIISYNNWEYTKLCLESVEKNTSYPNYEIILVDNGSNNQTIKYLKEIQAKNNHIRMIFNQENLGFPKANNQAAQIAQGEYLILLNNDTIVTPGWMHRLFRCLQSTPEAGMVGPVTNSIGNEAKIDVPYEDISEINSFSAERAKEFSGVKLEINVLALYCCMIPRKIFESVGGLDDRYEIGMFEDDDLAIKIRKKNLKLICAEDVYVHHFHSASFSNLSEDEYQRIFTLNKNKFEKKWGIKWQPHQYRDSGLQKQDSR